jgi:nicotinamidase-related amidase
MYSLIIVDMQESFFAKDSLEITKNIQREILSAINNQASIVFLEFSNSGATLACLSELPTHHGYRSYTIEKDKNDGANDVAALALGKDLPIHLFKIAGINTDYCVADTVAGLAALFPESTIEVIDNCCASLWSNGYPNKYDHYDGIQMMRKFKNVVITTQSELI